MRRSARDDRGNAPLEMGVLAVVFLLFISIIVAAGRLNVAHADVESAARTAARTISMARDPHGAVPAAREDAADAVRAGTSLCENWQFHPDISGDGTVTVTLRCDVRIDNHLLGLPGSMRVEQSAIEVRDRYRSGA